MADLAAISERARAAGVPLPTADLGTNWTTHDLTQ